MGIKAGVVVINRYCSPGSKMFFSYIVYMDREEAIRNETSKEYNLFNDYMGNPQKTSGLFTDGKSELTKKEISKLKERFSTAQENQSLMWQTVISFDNRWLEEQGMYDSKTGTLNERKLKEISNIAINKMLQKENLEHAIWTAAFHYNTDNIHIHVATVEENPKREKKLYQQYSYTTNEKNRLVKDGKIVDLKGNPVFAEEYKGKFKQSSFESCKQHIVKEITKDKDLNQDINKMIRERMVRTAKTNELMRDPELSRMILDLKEKLPNVSRSLWNYNNNIIASYRSELDQITDCYIEKYHGEEYAKLKQMIKMQSDMYKQAYGESTKNKDYEKTKMQDLHTRMGNSILKTIKVMDSENTLKQEGELFEADSSMEEKINTTLERESDEKVEKKLTEKYYLEWEKKFKKARYEISAYSRGNEVISEEKAYKALHALERLHRKGSVLAKYELGTIYKHGKIDIQDEEFAYEYYQDALRGYEYIYNNLDEYLESDGKHCSQKDKDFYQDYAAYRIGQMYNKGLGTELNYEKAREYFEKSNSSYAKYSLGELYFDGLGVDQDYEQAAKNYQEAIESDGENPYASFRLGQMYLSGFYFEKDSVKAGEHFKKALNGFEKWDKGTDMFLKYRIGYMYYKGYGTERNMEKAETYFKESLKLGNDGAKYMLGQIYINPESKLYDLKKGVEYLEQVYVEHPYAAYKLGKIYIDQDSPLHDLKKGIQYLAYASDQDLNSAQYELGKIYTNPESEMYDLKKGMEYFEKAAKGGHGIAMYKLGFIYVNEKSDYYDFQKGEEYLKKAMEAGNSQAGCKLGDVYYYQKNDKSKAMEYYKKAADMGNDRAKERIVRIIAAKRGNQLRRNFEYDKALRDLKKSFEKDYETWKNIMEQDASLERRLKQKTEEIE